MLPAIPQAAKECKRASSPDHRREAKGRINFVQFDGGLLEMQPARQQSPVPLSARRKPIIDWHVKESFEERLEADVIRIKERHKAEKERQKQEHKRNSELVKLERGFNLNLNGERKPRPPGKEDPLPDAPIPSRQKRQHVGCFLPEICHDMDTEREEEGEDGDGEPVWALVGRTRETASEARRAYGWAQGDSTETPRVVVPSKEPASRPARKEAKSSRCRAASIDAAWATPRPARAEAASARPHRAASLEVGRAASSKGPRQIPRSPGDRGGRLSGISRSVAREGRDDEKSDQRCRGSRRQSPFEKGEDVSKHGKWMQRTVEIKGEEGEVYHLRPERCHGIIASSGGKHSAEPGHCQFAEEKTVAIRAEGGELIHLRPSGERYTDGNLKSCKGFASTATLRLGGQATFNNLTREVLLQALAAVEDVDDISGDQLRSTVKQGSGRASPQKEEGEEEEEILTFLRQLPQSRRKMVLLRLLEEADKTGPLGPAEVSDIRGLQSQ